MQLIQSLPEGPLDLIGDIHGEIAALDRLLDRLGYDAAGHHRGGRRLVFLGDLTDRGPDSPAVLEKVAAMVAAGRAQCIVGNHELNLMRDVRKHGNDWWTHIDEQGQSRPEIAAALATSRLPAKPIYHAAKTRLMAFIKTLPVALQRDDLRVMHACWHPVSIQTLGARGLAGASVLELFNEYETRHNDKWFRGEGRALLREQWAGRDLKLLTDPAARPDYMPVMAQMDTEHQAGNPVAAVTSGLEVPVTGKVPFWAGGRWRMVERLQWWNDYADAVPVVVGHYWRRYRDVPTVYADKYGPDLFAGIEPHHWMGRRRNVYCVDFSVGGRSEQRNAGESEILCQLAALRVPEWQVVHDAGDVWEIGPPG